MAALYPELFDPAASAHRSEILAEIRRSHPIFFFEGDTYRAWVVTRYDHVKTLLRDPRLVQPSLAPRIASFPEAQQRQLFPLQEFARLNLGKTHARKLALRQATRAFFMPASVDGLRERIRELIDLLFAEVDVDGPVDLVGSLSYPLPARVLAEILGVPREDQPRFIDWSNALIQYFRSYTFEEFLAAQQGVVEMLDYCTRHIERRLREGAGQGDLADEWAKLLEQGRFEMGELAATSATFLMAGHENTSHFIANFFDTLFDHPDQLAEVVQDPKLIPGAMNEVLRYNGVVPFVTREVLEDMEFEGHRFEKGQLLSLSLVAANRDESRFTAVDRFDIRNASARHHLGFGHGDEYCRGAHLALMEAEELISFLFARFPGMRRLEGGTEIRRQPMLRRYITRFEVRLRPNGPRARATN